ncbi:MAG: TonB-dependent receptor [Bacteroidia bacterium]|nr:TonB-dependent receptor [Bacteroidia bacterium]
MKKFPLIVLILFASCHLFAQEKKLSLQFSHILFKELADTIEKTIPVKIYYSNNWVDSLYLNIHVNNDSITSLFDRSLENTGFFFIITDKNKVILSKGFRIKTNFSKEYTEQLKKKAIQPDTIQYFQLPPENKETSINDEFKIFKIGNPSALKNGGTAYISGTLINSITDEPLPGVIVYVEKLKVGAISNSVGYYTLELPKGQYQIEYRMVGLKPVKRNIVLYSNGALDVGMVQSTKQLDEVFVSANKENKVQDVKMGIEKISMKMIKQIPMGMGEADLFKSSLLLPGVQSVGEASNGFNIRGGSIDQNLILFDGAPIINPSHFFGFFSSFNSDIIEDVTLYKSGIPAKYGGRVSSVMDISLKKGSREKVNISGGISPFTGRLMVEAPILKKSSSFILSARTTYSDWILGLMKDKRLQKSNADFNDIQGLVTFDINPKNSVSVSGYLSNDSFDYFKEYGIRYMNLSSTIKWNHTYNTKLSSQFAGILSNYAYEIDSKQDSVSFNSLNYKLNQRILRSDFTYFPAEKHKVEFGLNATNYSLSPGTQKPIGEFSQILPKSLENEQAFESSIYLSDEFEYSPRLLFSGGLRFTLFTPFGPKTEYLYYPNTPRSLENISDTLLYRKGQIIRVYPGLEFRLLSRYIITPDLSVKAGIQRNFQYINMISNTTSMSPTDIWKLSDNYINPQRGDQFSLGIYKNFRSKAIETSVEVYYKILKNILDYKGGATLLMNDHLETDILNGKGKAYGIELMVKKQIGILTGWISYTYSRSLLKIDGLFEEEKVNGGRYFPANFDKPHDLKIVSNIKLSRRLNFTTNLIYNTGRPITYPVAYFNFYNVSRVFYSDRNEFRIPDYLRLDFSATMNGNLKFKKLSHSALTFTVYNVLGRRNPYSIFFKVEDGIVNGYQMSIFGQPIIMLTYSFRIRGNASNDL